MTTAYPKANNLSAKAVGIFIYAILMGLGLGFGARADDGVNIADGYAVHGYDVVAYFTEAEPTKGKDQYIAKYNGASYRFASAENRDLFAASPEQYAPQYGGYCAFGTAVGRKFDGDPTVWRIVGGKLYLNLNKNVQVRWLKNPAGLIRSANNNWPIIKNIPDAQLASGQPSGVTVGAR